MLLAKEIIDLRSMVRWLVLSMLLVGCTPNPFPPPPNNQDRELIAALSTPSPSQPPDTWSLPPTIMARVLTEGDLDVREVKAVGTGVTKPYKVTAWVPEYETEVAFKWKVVPNTGDDVNNSPRKEIVADLIQRWFLDPEDYVVPTSVLVCVPIGSFGTGLAYAEPNIPGSRCVLGNASVWLENVTFPKRGKLSALDWFCTPEIYDQKRFLNDPIYARSLSNMNLLTYLIKHQDGRCGNFLISADPSNFRIYSVDNGISFDNFWYRNYGTVNWESIFVPAFRREAIDRLHKITHDDITGLGVAVEMRADKDSILRIVTAGENMDASRGARIAPGRVQFGLTKSEIISLEQRVRQLLNAIDDERLATF